MRARLWLVMFLLLTSGHAFAQTAPAEQTLRKLLADFLTTASHSPASPADKRVFAAFFADDVIYTRSTGVVVNKSEIMKSLDEPPQPGAPTPTYFAEDVTVRQFGDTAIVAFRLVQRLSDGTTNRYRNTGTFLNRNGAWQVVAWQATRIGV